MDKQKREEWGWFITPEFAWAIRKEDHKLLLDRLRMTPAHPLTFALAFQEKEKSKLQTMAVNEHEKITGETRLALTIDGLVQWWTPFELEDGLAHGSNGKEAGTRFLCSLVPEEKPSLALMKGTEGKDLGGRPVKEKEQLLKMKKTISIK